MDDLYGFGLYALAIGLSATVILLAVRAALHFVRAIPPHGWWDAADRSGRPSGRGNGAGEDGVACSGRGALGMRAVRADFGR